jgi:hypothetical protein
MPGQCVFSERLAPMSCAWTVADSCCEPGCVPYRDPNKCCKLLILLGVMYSYKSIVVTIACICTVVARLSETIQNTASQVPGKRSRSIQAPILTNTPRPAIIDQHRTNQAPGSPPGRPIAGFSRQTPGGIPASEAPISEQSRHSSHN